MTKNRVIKLERGVTTDRFPDLLDTVGCFCQRKDDKFLILLRRSDKVEGNTWGLPAGKIELGESPVNAIRREVKEETGLDLSQASINHFSDVYIKLIDYDFLFRIFSTRLQGSPKVTLDPTTHQDFMWVTPVESFEKNLFPGLPECIKWFYNAT